MATSTNTVALAAHLTFPPWWVLALYLADTSCHLPCSRFVLIRYQSLYHWQNEVLLLLCMDELIMKPAWQFRPRVVVTLVLSTLCPNVINFSVSMIQ